jgi:hypothetical protein
MFNANFSLLILQFTMEAYYERSGSSFGGKDGGG